MPQTQDPQREARSEALARLKAFLEGGGAGPLHLEGLHPADLAEVVSHDLDPEEAYRVLRALDVDDAAAVLEEVDVRHIGRMLQQADAAWLAQILGRLPGDEAADLLDELPEGERLQVLCFLEPEDANALRKLIQYPPDSAGGVMTTEFLTARADDRVGDVLKRIKRDEGESEQVYNVYVVDDEGRLEGVVSTRDLLEANIHATVGEVMNPDVITARPDEDREEVARRILHYNLSSLPVVNAHGRILGIVTADDALEVLEQEGSEDALLLAGAASGSEATEPFWLKVAHRAPMLVMPVASGLLISRAIALFGFDDPEPSSNRNLHGALALVLPYLPLVLGLSGMVGTQTSAVLVRGFAVGQIVPGRRLQVFFGELKVAAALGFLAALVAAPVMALFTGETMAGVVLGLALLIAMTWSGALATTVAMASEAAGLDPALVSGPLMMAMSDLSAAVIFMLVASGLLT